MFFGHRWMWRTYVISIQIRIDEIPGLDEFFWFVCLGCAIFEFRSFMLCSLTSYHFSLSNITFRTFWVGSLCFGLVRSGMML
jgi:hypothetical protein